MGVSRRERLREDKRTMLLSDAFLVTVSASGDGQSAKGEILRVGRKCIVLLEGRLVGGAVGSGRVAGERLIHGLAHRLPKHPSGWAVSVTCSIPAFEIRFGSEADGEPSTTHPFMEHILEGGGFRGLEEALMAIARIIGRSCG